MKTAKIYPDKAAKRAARKRINELQTRLPARYAAQQTEIEPPQEHLTRTKRQSLQKVTLYNLCIMTRKTIFIAAAVIVAVVLGALCLQSADECAVPVAAAGGLVAGWVAHFLYAKYVK